MTHALPLTFDGDGQLRFAPRTLPAWTPTPTKRAGRGQTDAQPLAMDGIVDGDPHEPLRVVGHTAISWLGPPIDKWVMLYGGGLSSLLVSSEDTSDAPAPGAIVMRFADHPWGPWSPPTPHLGAGRSEHDRRSERARGVSVSPRVRVDAVFGMRAARRVAHRPKSPRRDLRCQRVAVGCRPVVRGEHHRPVHDAQRRGGFDMIWNVSDLNPYAVVLMKSAINPPVSVTPRTSQRNPRTVWL